MSYQAEARIVGRLHGTSTDVVVGARGSSPRSHPSFVATSITRRLLDVPPTPAGAVPDNDPRTCSERAREFVARELPAAYSIDVGGAQAFPGHAWVEGHWRPTNAAHVSHAFPLLRNNEPIEEECIFQDPSGNAQTLTFSWWVVVQPK